MVRGYRHDGAFPWKAVGEVEPPRERDRLNTIEAIGRLLFVDDEPAEVDSALVLGNNFEPTMDPAIHLYRCGPTWHILVSGAWRGSEEGRPPQAERFVRYPRERGVPEAALLQET